MIFLKHSLAIFEARLLNLVYRRLLRGLSLSGNLTENQLALGFMLDYNLLPTKLYALAHYLYCYTLGVRVQ